MTNINVNSLKVLISNDRISKGKVDGILVGRRMHVLKEDTFTEWQMERIGSSEVRMWGVVLGK